MRGREFDYRAVSSLFLGYKSPLLSVVAPVFLLLSEKMSNGNSYAAGIWLMV